MSRNRLYMARMISAPDDAYRLVLASEASEEELWQAESEVFIGAVEYYKVPVAWEPDGWKEFALDRWGPDVERHEYEGVITLPYMPFFWPKTGKIVRSRSSAQRTVDIIRSWGGQAEVLECTPDWETIPNANARRRRERNAPTIAKLRARIKEMESA